MRRPFHVALALALSAGCAPAASELILVVDSNLEVPTELDEIVVEIDGPTQSTEVRQSLTGDDAPRLPLTLGIAPADLQELGPLTIRVRGRERSSDIVETQVTTTLVPNQSRSVRLLLLRGCIGRQCSSQDSCGEAGCERAVVEPPDLDEWTGEAPTFESSDPCINERWDQDGDGFGAVACGGTDCDDDEITTSQGAREICGDGVDNNCNDETDEPGCT